jgi:peptidoglycan/xylan/chitin deacetylase (PgdA/CDA1 family)
VQFPQKSVVIFVGTGFYFHLMRISRHLFPFPLRLLKKSSSGLFVLPFYHCVSPEVPPHISALYAARTPEQFEDDIRFLLRHWQPATMDELIAHGRGEKKIKEPKFMLTFDDGLREFGTFAVPILEKYSLTACCFINPDFVDNKGLFYRYKASLLANALPENKKEYLLSMQYNQDAELERLAKEAGFSFKNYLREEQPYLTLTEINELERRGFLFGAHSMSHPEYRFMAPDNQISQTIRSLQYVASNLATPYRLFAFPFTDFGVGNDFFQSISPYVDITFGTAGYRQDAVTWNLQRIPMEQGARSARSIISGEMLYFSMLKLIGKQTIYRNSWTSGT